MADLKEILLSVEERFQVPLSEIPENDHRIENVQYLLSGSLDNVILRAQTLYIGDYQEFSSIIERRGFFLFLNAPADAIKVKYGASIYGSIPALDLLNHIQNLIFEGQKANLLMKSIFHILQAGHGIQTILDTARRFLNNPITLCSTSFSLIAVTPKYDKDPSFEENSGKFYLTKQSLANMREKGVFEKLFHSPVPFIENFNDDPGTDFIFCSVRINRATVGYICMRCCERAYTKKDLSALQDISKALSIEMQKDSFFTQQRGAAHEYFLRDLIEQNITDSSFAFHRMAQLGRPARSYFWVLIFSFIDNQVKKLSSQYYIEQLDSIFPHSICFSYQNNLVLLRTSRYDGKWDGVDLEKFRDFMHLNHILVSMSYRYEEILDTHLYYKQALYLLNAGSSPSGNYCITYLQNFHNHLFELVSDAKVLSAMVHPDIYTLLTHDKNYKTDYIRTLKAFFINQRSAAKTSDFLHIHKSTFFYRIGKIQSFTEFDLENNQIMFAYELSFYILEFLDKSNGIST
jgi:sugar diacid utilization regulator